MKEINRREFLKKTGKMALACAAAFGFESVFLGGSPIRINLAYGEKSQAKFNVYNAINSHVKSIQSHTYQDCLSQNYAPGIIYKTTKPMVAVAKGTVTRIMELPSVSLYWSLGDDPEGATGFMVIVTHGREYYSCYYHLQQLDVKFADKVERGQRIGSPDERWNIARLLFMEEGRGNAMDPDNFGTNHSFMTYWDGVTDLDIGKEEQDKRLENQKQLLYKLAGLYSDPIPEYTLLRKKHTSKDGTLFNWSTIEKFRYIEYLHQNNPETFTSLTKEKFEEIRKEFYRNQPIVLTLPFKKG